ncbi:sterol O-acyltransferase 1 [Camelus dromedarius]|uniref:sterol O-acyltransferase 1 n=1 Tax=Camelus dromedarius TaxID=9838 RepID=UPI00057BB139|nr:sterol O-acyltransferase 1 [Camelus dromedarius]
MVGEEKMSLRKRLSKSSEDAEEKEERQGDRSEEPLEILSNGRNDLKQLIAKKIQLTAEAEELKPFFMKEVGNHFDDFVTNLIEKSTSLDNGGCSLTSFSVLGENHHRAKDQRARPEHGKIFVIRRSLLDELFEVDHIRTIYHMFIALFILFILSTLVVDYIDEGRLVLDFNLMSYAFGKFPVVIWTWCTMFLCTLSVPYFLFQRWARGYHRSSHPVVYSLLYCFLFVVFQTVVLGFGPPYVVLAYTLPPASRCIIILEQIRLIMKTYSFVRENVPRVLNSAKEKSSTVPIPTVNQYLYFLFAPTLIYRDNYPRTPSVRWGYVAMQFAQFLGCLFYVYYIFKRLCGPLFRNIKEEPFSARVLVLCVFNSILPGVLIQLLIFFAFLHCWLNAFAEMLRFGDRMFYKDWWNSTSYSNYYRTWNVVVHDWLYYYAYKDFLWFFTKKFRSAAMLAVFAVSAVVHEYALALCLNFFYPVLFVLFMFFGMAFNFLVNDSRKRPIWNVLMWASLFTGHGVILCFYSQEWYARQRCPLKNPTFLNYIQPHSWTCRYTS